MIGKQRINMKESNIVMTWIEQQIYIIDKEEKKNMKYI